MSFRAQKTNSYENTAGNTMLNNIAFAKYPSFNISSIPVLIICYARKWNGQVGETDAVINTNIANPPRFFQLP